MIVAKTVSALGYLRLNVSDPAAWDALAQKVLGLQRGRCGVEGAQRYRMDGRAYRLETIGSTGDGLAGIGWEVADARTWETLRGRLEKASIPVTVATPSTLLAKGVRGLLCCADPAGSPLEIYWGARLDISPFTSPRGVRFVAGDLGLGHVVLGIERTRYRDTLDFYRDMLGFRTSDLYRLHGREVTFLHCNARHHSLALAEWEGGPALVHFMLETDDLDAVGLALDACHLRGVQIKRALGRHSNDRMVSFYAQTPSGFDVECGWGGRLIDEATWTVTEIEHGTLWGHRPGSETAS